MATKHAPRPTPPRNAPKAAVKAAPAKVAAPKVTDTKAAVNWDEIALPDAAIVEYVRTSTRTKVDLEEATPAAIKARVTSAWEASAKAGKPIRFTQQCGTAALAEEFLKVAKKYATFKEMTLRGRQVPDSDLNILVQRKAVPADTKAGSVVVYSVGNRETRTRKPAK